MAKVPLAGTVKTRLQSILSPEKCAELAFAFLQDAIKRAEIVCKNVILAYSPAGQSEYFKGIVSSKITLIEQKGEDLGKKMSDAFKFVFARDSDSKVLIIGTDSPNFPAEFVAQAFEKLSGGAQIVLGKTADGGFYLLGLTKFVPALFENIEWSSPKVSRQLLENAEKLEIGKIEFIPTWFDVDTPDDLRRLQREMLANENARATAPETFRWIEENAEIF